MTPEELEARILTCVKKVVASGGEPWDGQVAQEFDADIEDGIVYIMRKDGKMVAAMHPDTYEAICKARKT